MNGLLGGDLRCMRTSALRVGDSSRDDLFGCSRFSDPFCSQFPDSFIVSIKIARMQNVRNIKTVELLRDRKAGASTAERNIEYGKVDSLTLMGN